jgi:orotate phosphoribosyltransferase-like protein
MQFKNGCKEEKKKNAKKMKEMKMSDEQICQVLNISKNELRILLED